MFSRDDFKEEGKNRIENKRENGHEWCLVERGGQNRYLTIKMKLFS